MGMIKFLSKVLLMTSLMTTVTVARYIPANNYILLEKLINRYDPSVINYDYIEDDPDNQMAAKKDALLLEKLMLTLQKNTEEDSQMMDFQDRKNSLLEEPQFQKLMIRRNRSENRKTGMDLQRRGRINGSVYWKCYFNAVTCF
ncbi:uncharacterized protein LOC130667825 [Microplitis mediator]|uniref:uncharacterized protein LOC130667825 n=1 Tax=Microplitis mediator TaxID=375433 RepID=UPI00255618A4|nr:uncharacterized protein LOC130667825 [Microplitis mediator]XP_057325665.1 uncharacterized protein LOC130667825 [Microplitis mediator]